MAQAKKSKRRGKRLKRNLSDLADLAEGSKQRFDKALKLAKTGEYTGEKMAGDLIDQLRDLWNVLTNVYDEPDSDEALVYLPSDPNQGSGGWYSDVLSFDEPYNAAEVSKFTRSDLLGPAVNGTQLSIPAAKVEIELDPVGAKTTDYYVKVTQSPKQPGLYRGVILKGGLLMTNVQAYAYAAPPPPPLLKKGKAKRSKTTRG